MKKCAILFLFTLQCLLHQSIFAQHQQLLFTDLHNKFSICAQHRGLDGSMVSAARIVDSTGNSRKLVYKTDKSGGVLWAYKDTFYSASEKMRLGKLNNGDYMVMECDYDQVITRLNQDGVVKWERTVQFSTSYSPAITGFTELPNGNIVVCGYNDIDPSLSSDVQYQGFLAFFDSTGVLLKCNYYGHAKTSITDNYSFYDVKYLNNNLYTVGNFNKYFPYSISNGLLMVMDTIGNLKKTLLLETPLASGTDTLWQHYFYDLSLIDGKLFAGGRDGQYGSKQLIVQIDTSTFTIKGYTILSKSYSSLLNAVSFVQDTNNIYSIITPRVAYYSNRIFTTKIHKGSVEYCKKIEQDSILSINSFFMVKDTAFLGGRNNVYSKGYSSYFSLSDTAKGCGMSDTSVTVNSFSAMLVPPIYTPNVTSKPVTSYTFNFWAPHCLYSLYRCGDPLCPSSLVAELDTFTKSEICYGDTFSLAAKGCYPKKWYRDGIELKDKSEVLKITTPGNYMLVVSNNACSDTSLIISIHSKFFASIVNSGDTLFSSNGASYQWLDSSYKKIIGATDHYFVPTFSGKYYVLVTDSSGCTQLSEFILYERPLGLQQIRKMEEKILRVFPNPASSKINIGNYSGNSAMLSIKDVTGRTVINWQQKSGLQEYDVNQLGLKAGVYWIQLTHKQFCATEKIIILSNAF